MTGAQARALGYSSQSIGRRTHSGAWRRIFPGVYLVTGREPRFEQRALAALFWAGKGAVLSHITAATLWRLTPLTTDVVELWLAPERRLRHPSAAVHRGPITPNDRRRLDGFSLTAPARTLLDVAARVDDETLESMTEEVLRRGLSTEHAIRRCLDRAGGTGRPGSGRLRALLDERGNAKALESRLEVRIWRLLRSAGLRPTRQHPVRYDATSYRLDFAWPALRVAVEGDGYDAHGGHHAFERDHARLAVLASHGWLVIPVTWKQVSNDPAAVLASVRGALLGATA